MDDSQFESEPMSEEYSEQCSNLTSSDSVNPDDIISILLASDIHLGYKETDKERGQDSYDAFEEVLQIAVSKNVDFILLGGDLFDIANPSSFCLNRCLMLLRTYCMGGDKPIHIEFLSDQSVNFAESLNKTVNYEDENLNISIPVFSIHGNHDDSSGFGNLSAMDILSTSGLVNYFGKLTNLQELELNPIMLQKGETKLAIFGMSYIQDNRLTRLFEEQKVKLALPDECDTEWFNMFVLHQNRANRGTKNYLPEESLPDVLDFIVWGHEHDCRIDPEQNPNKRFYVSQPGSTVATSLAAGEAGVKKCAVLQIYKKNFKIESIPLKTVRPFVFDTLRMADVLEENDEDANRKGSLEERVLKVTHEKIAEMLQKAEELRTGHPKQPKLPLIRLRIEVTDTLQMFQPVRFGQTYSKVVANSDDMIMFKRQLARRKDDVKLDKKALEEAFREETETKVTKVEDVVKRYFDEVEDSKKLKILSMDVMSELTRYIINGSSKTDEILDFYTKQALKYIEGSTENEVDQKLDEFRARDDKTFNDLLTVLDDVRNNAPIDVDEEDVDDESPVAPARGTRGRGRAAATASTRARGRGSRGGRGASNTRTPQLNFSRGAPAKQKGRTITLSSDSE